MPSHKSTRAVRARTKSHKQPDVTSDQFVRAVEADIVKLGGIAAYAASVRRYREAIAASKAVQE